MPGIDPINALTILAVAEDLPRFSHHRQFLKFCGVDLATIQSGGFRDKFEQYISKDRTNTHLLRKAYTAIVTKTARTIHAVNKDGEPCHPSFEG